MISAEFGSWRRTATRCLRHDFEGGKHRWFEIFFIQSASATARQSVVNIFLWENDRGILKWENSANQRGKVVYRWSHTASKNSFSNISNGHFSSSTTPTGCTRNLKMKCDLLSSWSSSSSKYLEALKALVSLLTTFVTRWTRTFDIPRSLNHTECRAIPIVSVVTISAFWL